MEYKRNVNINIYIRIYLYKYNHRHAIADIYIYRVLYIYIVWIQKWSPSSTYFCILLTGSSVVGPQTKIKPRNPKA